MAPRRLTRRQFVARGGGFIVVVGTGAALAGCGGDDDTSSPSEPSDSGGSPGTSGPSGTTAPASDGGLPLARVDAPVELPDNEATAIASGLDPETGTLTIFTYADYINPDTIAAFEEQYGVSVELATFDTEARLLAGLQNTPYDLVVGATTIGLPRFVVGNLIQPINHDYLTNFSNVLPSLQDPYYDLGSKYSVPYTVYTTGLAYRRDVIDDAVFDESGWETIWDEANRGYVGIIDDPRDALTLGMYKLGITDTNTDDPAIIEQARDAIDELVAATNARIDILAYQKIPEGTSHINQAWSGDMLAAQYYLPEDTGVEVLGYWAPENTTVANDFMVIPASAEHPVLAHHFIDFLTDPDNATQNFEWVGYQPALSSPSPDDLIAAELVPEQLVSALVTDAQVENGYRLDALAPDVQLLWEDAFQQVKAG